MCVSLTSLVYADTRTRVYTHVYAYMSIHVRKTCSATVNGTATEKVFMLVLFGQEADLGEDKPGARKLKKRQEWVVSELGRLGDPLRVKPNGTSFFDTEA